MNSKILLAAVLGGFLLLSSKKSKPKSSSTPVKKDEDVIKEDVDDLNVEEEEKPPINVPIAYKTITTARKQIIDNYLDKMPVNTSDLAPYNDYNEWAKIQEGNNVKPLYQNFLATAIYHHISVSEGKTDVYTKFGEQSNQFDGSLPYILQRGIKGTISDDDTFVELIAFNEFQDEANKRLAKGIALWGDIKKYINANIDLNICPEGVVCK